MKEVTVNLNITCYVSDDLTQSKLYRILKEYNVLNNMPYNIAPSRDIPINSEIQVRSWEVLIGKPVKIFK